MSDVSGWIYILGESAEDPAGAIHDTVEDARATRDAFPNGPQKVWRVPITAHLDRATEVDEGAES